MGQNRTDLTNTIDRNPNSNAGGAGMVGQRRSVTPNKSPMPMSGDHPGNVQNAGTSLKAPKL